MKLEKLALYGAVFSVLGLLAPSCATRPDPVFFGRTPRGSVDSRPIEAVKLDKEVPTRLVPKGMNAGKLQFAGPGQPAGKTQFAGRDVPSRWPVDNEHEVLSPFGRRGKRGKHFHQGYDIRAAMRTPVKATADGLVVEQDSGGAYGKRIVIDHGGGYSSTYAHLDQPLVKVGQVVKGGEEIALSGQSGNATTPHVHYEVHRNGSPINPGPYLP